MVVVTKWNDERVRALVGWVDGWLGEVEGRMSDCRRNGLTWTVRGSQKSRQRHSVSNMILVDMKSKRTGLGSRVRANGHATLQC